VACRYQKVGGLKSTSMTINEDFTMVWDGRKKRWQEELQVFFLVQ
jgi:hypothetical protein